MDAYLANLDALFGSLLPFLAVAVLFVVQVVFIAAWIGRGRPNPYDFDEHADTAMAILTPDDPQLARVEQWVRDMRPLTQEERTEEIRELEARWSR